MLLQYYNIEGKYESFYISHRKCSLKLSSTVQGVPESISSWPHIIVLVSETIPSACYVAYKRSLSPFPADHISSYWSPRQSLLPVMWSTRGHGQKPPITMRCSIQNNREWKILGVLNKNVNCVINYVTDYCDKRVNLVLYFSVLIGC